MKKINEYLNRMSWEEKENSNVGFSVQGLNASIFKKASKEYWLSEIYTKEIREAHKKGIFHISDLGGLTGYCMGLDLKDLLTVGFTGVKGKLSCRPPKHFRSALGQAINMLFSIQQEIMGAVAFSNFDTLLAPFVAIDSLTYKEVKQGLQEFVYSCNVATRVAGETPFINLSFDIDVPKSMLEEPVIIGGKRNDKKVYGDFQRAMDMINKAFCECMLEGDGSGKPFSFPIPTYSITKGFDWSDSRHNPIFKLAGKLGAPYFANYLNSSMDPEDAFSMCCRLRIDKSKLQNKNGGGLFGSNPLTGSIGVVTINLPNLFARCIKKGCVYEEVEKIISLAVESLHLKRMFIEKQTEAGLYPYLKFYLRNIKKKTGSYWGNHFSTIGLIGMNEALAIRGFDLSNSNVFTKEFLEHVNKCLLEEQEKTGELLNLEATPAESLSYRLAQKDKKNGIVKGYEYYTNSTCLPAENDIPLINMLEHQDTLLCEYTGGSVQHVYMGTSITGELAKNTIKTICENFKMPYLSLSPTFSVCDKHGVLHGDQTLCPACGSKVDVYKKIVGYIRPVRMFNKGKILEHKKRHMYSGL